VTGIRPADARDGPELTALDVATWSPRVSPAPAPDPASAFFGGGHRPGDVLVAERGGRVVGYVLAPDASARRLYESCGFVVEGVLRDEFVLDGRPVDDLLMACAL